MQTKKSKKKFIGANISDDLHAQLIACAKRENRSVSGQIVVFLTKGVEHLDRGDADVKSA